MKVLLIWPGIALTGWNSLHDLKNHDASSKYPSNGYMTISAVLKEQGHTVSLLDLRALSGWDHFKRELAKQDFDIAGIGFMSCDLLVAQNLTIIFRQVFPIKILIIGGLHVTLTRIRKFPGADCVVHGEADTKFTELVNLIESTGKTPAFVEAGIVQNLDSLPLPDRSLFGETAEYNYPLLPKLPSPMVSIIHSRGCNHRCTFCSPSGVGISGRKLRVRSVNSIIEELQFIQRKQQIGSVMLHSDLTAGSDWLDRLADAYGNSFDYLPFWCQMRADFIYNNQLLIKKLRRIGLIWVSVGFESGSERILKFLRKGISVELYILSAQVLHDNGINILANFMLGLPHETNNDRCQTLSLAKSIRPAWYACNEYINFPGSKLFAYVKSQNLLSEDHFNDWAFPWQRKIKGIDYAHVSKIKREMLSFT